MVGPMTRICVGHTNRGETVPCAVDLTGSIQNKIRCDSCRGNHERDRARVRWHRDKSRKNGCGSRGIAFMRNANESVKVKELKCDWCGSMPHACEPSRYLIKGEGSSERKVQIAPNYECVKCGLKFQPLPPVRAVATIGSSGGTAARHGELHGYDKSGNVDARKYTSADAYPRMKTFQRNKR